MHACVFKAGSGKRYLFDATMPAFRFTHKTRKFKMSSKHLNLFNLAPGSNLSVKEYHFCGENIKQEKVLQRMILIE